MNEALQRILEAGVCAPSGGNSQPWRFEVQGNVINVFSLPEKDHPILNFRQRGTLIAHGALAENIVIASYNEGLKAYITAFPDPAKPTLIFSVAFEKSAQQKHELYDSIFLRATNRKKYEDISLAENERQELIALGEKNGSTQIMLIEDKELCTKLGQALSVNEIVMLENKKLHEYFYREVRWTEKDEQKEKTGLYAKTMELLPPQLAVFKLLKNWSIARFLIKMGIAKFIAKENAKLYGSCSAIGIIAVEDNDKDFFDAGRVMQRVWLKATQMGLAMHLVTGVLYLGQRIEAGMDEEFSKDHSGRVLKAYQDIKNIFNIQHKVIPVAFRIGHGGLPSARSSRLAPDVEWNN